MGSTFDITFDFWAVLLFFGMLQGFLFVGILLTQRQRNKANYFLATLVLVIALNLFQYLLVHSGSYVRAPYLQHIFTPLSMLIGPCYYVYIKSIASQNFTIKPSLLLHLIPLFVGIVFLTPFYLLNAEDKIVLVQAQLETVRQPLDLGTFVFLSLQIVISFGYVFYALKILWNAKQTVRTESATRKYRWLLKFGYFFMVFWAVDFLALVWYFFQQSIHQEAYYLTMLFCAASINALVVFAFKNYKTFSQIFLGNAAHKYGTSNMEKKDLQKHLTEIVHYMDSEKPYLDSEFSLLTLSDQIQKPKHIISQALNIELGKNFYEFINEYRYNEVKERLTDPQYRNLTIIAIAFDSGFSNKNTFNKVFKKMAGVTPSQYLQQHSN
ncbi:helix-turn-helix domain-containing protein [Aureisphaera galaxeae]|uniref:helix-turn-helix domain-containing protein n=1 Tax=Aureisphaera galaxeae TaxID=1538023 RepID=UPI00235049EA|nr:helix-turn-helix domain-containing protein [Aureisphaera galaxeae]MDC8004156.1 helix-turn-helix domain-containing protein [Aureisphaera galaxeae]